MDEKKEQETFRCSTNEIEYRNKSFDLDKNCSISHRGVYDA